MFRVIKAKESPEVQKIGGKRELLRWASAKKQGFETASKSKDNGAEVDNEGE